MQIVQKVTGVNGAFLQIGKKLLAHKKSPFRVIGFHGTCGLVVQVLTAGIHQDQGLANVVGNLLHIHSPFISVPGRIPGLAGKPNQKSGVFSISLSIEPGTGSNRNAVMQQWGSMGCILPGFCELCLIIL